MLGAVIRRRLTAAESRSALFTIEKNNKIAEDILTTNINLDEGACDLDLAESVAELFGLGAKPAREIVAEVGRATASWRAVAATVGARPAEIRRMESAFEHVDSRKARAF